MASHYRLQIVRYDVDQTPEVVVTWPPGRDAERDLIAAITDHVRDAERDQIPALVALVQSKGVGIGRTEAHVLTSVSEVLTERCRAASDVSEALAECFTDAKRLVRPQRPR